jgi:hypothetical protein
LYFYIHPTHTFQILCPIRDWSEQWETLNHSKALLKTVVAMHKYGFVFCFCLQSSKLTVDNLCKNNQTCDTMAKKYAELREASAYSPPIIFEIDSDHTRAMMELGNEKKSTMGNALCVRADGARDIAKRPYADRLRECEEALARHYAEMDTLLATRGPPGEVARVTKAIVGEVKCEAGIARELAADPAYADRAAGFADVCLLVFAVVLFCFVFVCCCSIFVLLIYMTM